MSDTTLYDALVDAVNDPAMEAEGLSPKWSQFARRLAAFLGDKRTRAFASYLFEWLVKKTQPEPAPPGGAA